MKMKDEVYDVLKWVVMIVLPAFSVLVKSVGTALGWAATDTAVTIVNAITLFLGACIGASNADYLKGGDDNSGERPKD